MNNKTRFMLLAVAAVLVLVWGLGMDTGDKKGGYSDETTYYSAAELREREKVIAQMAEMRGETPPPSATPEPEKEDKLDEKFAAIQMQEVPQSYTLKSIGYDARQQILLAAVAYLPAGIALGWTYEKSNTIWAPILLHMAINGISFGVMSF